MVYLTGAQCEGRSIKLGSPDVMFDASTWRIRNIWDGVKLEVAGDASPVVLHSFTQLDPDLPQLEGLILDVGHNLSGMVVFRRTYASRPSPLLCPYGSFSDGTRLPMGQDYQWDIMKRG
uniref:Uncharacterized protein n=1 Tax=Oncorhynchus tshawytscha TaxID=74940 RepID=A0A8C8CZY9_ONCTS